MQISISKPLLQNRIYNIVNSKKSDNNNISFGDNYDELNLHNETEYEYAKAHLGEDDWEQKYFQKRYEQIYPSKEYKEDDGLTWEIFINLLFWFLPEIIDECIIDKIKESQVKKTIAPEIRRIKDIMFQLNNEKLRAIEDQKKEYSADLQVLQKDKDAKQKLYENFIKPLGSSDSQNFRIPTAIMIEGADEKSRKDIIEWAKEQIIQRQSEYTLPEDEDDALYRITTEIGYAQNYYDKTGKRTVMFVENFANILNPSKVSSETITEMKAIMSDISEEQSPCSIVFDTDDASKLDKAFTGNKIRIPLRVKLDK